MVMQPAANFFVGGSNPGRPPSRHRHGSRPARIRTADRKICNRLRYQSTVGCYDRNVHPHCLEPSDYKLFYHALGYAARMTLKKGGYTTPAPALDLTTSLRGDWYFIKGSVTRAPFPPPPSLAAPPPSGGLPRAPPPPPRKPIFPSPNDHQQREGSSHAAVQGVRRADEDHKFQGLHEDTSR